MLESSGGRNDSCLKKGKVNGFGYRVNKFEEVCYKSYQEVRKYVENWVNDKAEKGFTLGELLCYYNKGVKTESCQYYKNYQKLK